MDNQPTSQRFAGVVWASPEGNALWNAMHGAGLAGPEMESGCSTTEAFRSWNLRILMNLINFACQQILVLPA